MPYKAKGRCVYRADTGKKVGCTKGPVKKYLAALHANVPDAKNESKNNTTMNPAALKNIVQHLANKAEYIQYDLGERTYDVEFSTIANIIEDSKDKKLKNFWNGLSEKQQTEIYGMVHQFLLNKEIKRDPEYFGDDEQPQTINYTLSPKTKVSGPTPKGKAMDKLVKKLAKDVEDWVNYVDIGDSPYDIMFDDFVEFVIDTQNRGGSKIKKFWHSLKASQQEKLFEKIVNFLEKKHRYDDGEGDDEMYEGNNMKKIKLSEMVEKIFENRKNAPLMLNGKEVERGSIEIDGINPKDYPDFSDAYISAASYVDGTPVDDNDLGQLEDENYGLVNDLAHDRLFQEAYDPEHDDPIPVSGVGKKYRVDWEDDERLAREFEKSDVSWEEFDRIQNPQSYMNENIGGNTVTFNGKEVDLGNIQFGMQDGTPYVTSAKYTDGSDINDTQYEELEKAINSQYKGGINALSGKGLEENWRDDPKLSRDFEKSDVSADEFEKSRGLGAYGSRGGGYKPKMVGITFFNVPAGKEDDARNMGLSQFKSGKWGYKHSFDKNVISVASDREKSVVSAAERIFGKGRYWEPRN